VRVVDSAVPDNRHRKPGAGRVAGGQPAHYCWPRSGRHIPISPSRSPLRTSLSAAM
jgi:hypothetical protein